MQKVFIPSTHSLVELQKIIDIVDGLSLPKEDIFIGGTFDKFIRTLSSGDTAIIYSLEIFNSIIEILGTMNDLTDRGVKFISIKEPWFNNEKVSGKDVLIELFNLGSRIHNPTGAPTMPLDRVKRSGVGSRILPLVERVESLRKEHNVPVVKACKIAGCSIKAYYTYRTKL